MHVLVLGPKDVRSVLSTRSRSRPLDERTFSNVFAILVADRALASRVQVALATHPETRRYRITVEAMAGVVTLEGTAAMDEAVDVARGVVGVRDVKTQQVDIPPLPPFVA